MRPRPTKVANTIINLRKDHAAERSRLPEAAVRKRPYVAAKETRDGGKRTPCPNTNPRIRSQQTRRALCVVEEARRRLRKRITKF